MINQSIHIAEVSDTQVRITSTPDAAILFDQTNPWGHAYRRTLDEIGVGYEMENHIAEFTGDMAAIQSSIRSGSFDKLIDVIAQESSVFTLHEFQRASQANIALRALSSLNRRTLPELLHSSTSLAETAMKITAHLGSALLLPRPLRIITGSRTMEAA